MGTSGGDPVVRAGQTWERILDGIEVVVSEVLPFGQPDEHNTKAVIYISNNYRGILTPPRRFAMLRVDFLSKFTCLDGVSTK